jgi:hypothetical protein
MSADLVAHFIGAIRRGDAMEGIATFERIDDRANRHRRIHKARVRHSFAPSHFWTAAYHTR